MFPLVHWLCWPWTQSCAKNRNTLYLIGSKKALTIQYFWATHDRSRISIFLSALIETGDFEPRDLCIKVFKGGTILKPKDVQALLAAKKEQSKLGCTTD
jgi:hypothetical protein